MESVIELAGPHKAEYLKRIIRAVARNAAKRDHLGSGLIDPEDEGCSEGDRRQEGVSTSVVS
ncbi:hypothetical protein, partial [Mesorhizobium sp. M0208]|uniref:hypothetical protein n=1 Tax=Mesorhizobium sp. M0208 TaxID=2956916 RepID=UPI00333C7207